MRQTIILASAILATLASGTLPAAEPAAGTGTGGGEVRDWRYTLTIHEITQADDEERLAKLVGDNPDRMLARLSDGRTPVHVAA